MKRTVSNIILEYLRTHFWAYSFSFKNFGLEKGALYSDETYARILRKLVEKGEVKKKRDKKFTIYYV